MNTTLRPLALAAAVLAGAALSPSSAVAAESYDNCSNFITSLPTTITTQGVWCLKANLSTALSSGAAITIDANNVTIDCNDFKIGGLAAGTSSTAKGVAGSQLNSTVRNCGIRGFYYGIDLGGGANLVEDNRLDGNLYMAIRMDGDDNLVRNNRIYDTGGAPGSQAIGIYGETDVVDNVVAGVFSENYNVYGISTYSNASEVRGNAVRRLLPGAGDSAFGIKLTGLGSVAADNRVLNPASASGTALENSGTGGFCASNIVRGFTTAYAGCPNSFGNLPVIP